MDTTPSQLLALLRPLFQDSAILRFLSDTEPDASGGELHRIRIDFAHDAISLRIPRPFVDEYRDGPSSQGELDRRLARFVSRKLKSFAPNPGPRLRPVVTWTFTEETV
jgi:hypothetical protein